MCVYVSVRMYVNPPPFMHGGFTLLPLGVRDFSRVCCSLGCVARSAVPHALLSSLVVQRHWLLTVSTPLFACTPPSFSSFVPFSVSVVVVVVVVVVVLCVALIAVLFGDSLCLLTFGLFVCVLIPPTCPQASNFDSDWREPPRQPYQPTNKTTHHTHTHLLSRTGFPPANTPHSFLFRLFWFLNPAPPPCLNVLCCARVCMCSWAFVCQK
ncbi:hypothetical protein PTSG_11818 [Salpingoeca rosetta]|uniref:Uncharacterized protein n=1 Tax=Salpingoeca rosetta (strain ATCC 50818 / BSB-021) TaxID=946362 RepID=F2TZI5_SALR5|nr:uncharacterized protein PTSG_11818 [Salpingoeca rosetta]EGD79009.1 hypothetical protein PTSG_11818 [Salpingoeca rosetta]|eukprot:XP_004997965.1 hypothetical protein PTSG_11818 [Salpingoeca rosetta]